MSRSGEIFYAGGTKGPNVRADGSGGQLARGWYVWGPSRSGRFGPFATLTEAKAHPQAFGASVTPKHTQFEQLWLSAHAKHR